METEVERGAVKIEMQEPPDSNVTCNTTGETTQFVFVCVDCSVWDVWGWLYLDWHSTIPLEQSLQYVLHSVQVSCMLEYLDTFANMCRIQPECTAWNTVSHNAMLLTSPCMFQCDALFTYYYYLPIFWPKIKINLLLIVFYFKYLMLSLVFVGVNK